MQNRQVDIAIRANCLPIQLYPAGVKFGFPQYLWISLCIAGAEALIIAVNSG